MISESLKREIKLLFNFNLNKENDFLHELINFCVSNKLRFDEFDNFMWLLGKISKGSLSLLSNKNTYLQIINKLNIQETESEKIDKEISIKILQDEYLELIKDYISDDLYNFILFFKNFLKI